LKPPRSPSVDEARLRPHLRRGQPARLPSAGEPELDDDPGVDVATPAGMRRRVVTPSPGELRGIPCIGRAGGAGAIRGSDPVAEVLRRGGQGGTAGVYRGTESPEWLIVRGDVAASCGCDRVESSGRKYGSAAWLHRLRQKIVDYRTAHGAFRSVDALDDVPGIGPSRVEQLRGLVVP